MKCYKGSGLLFMLWTLTLLPAEWGSKICSLTQHQGIQIEIMICHSAWKPGTKRSRSRSTFTLLPAEWGSTIWSLTQHQEIPSPIDLYTITGRMRKQNLKTDLVPINPDRVHIIQFHLWTVPRVLASRSCSGPLHYYRQNEEAKSEVLLSTKRFRSRSWYIIPLVS